MILSPDDDYDYDYDYDYDDDDDYDYDYDDDDVKHLMLVTVAKNQVGLGVPLARPTKGGPLTAAHLSRKLSENVKV